MTEAYKHYWELRAEALFALDASRLGEVAAGEHLDNLRAFIGELRDSGEASDTHVEHHFVVLKTSEREAVIGDDYTSYSMFVDPKTHVRLTDPSPDNLQEIYTFHRIDGTWKVVAVVRSF